MSLQAFLETGK